MPVVTLTNNGKGPRVIPTAGGNHVLLQRGEVRENISLTDGDYGAVTGGPVVAVVTGEAPKTLPPVDDAEKTGQGSEEALSAVSGYSVKDKGRGWFVIVKDGEDVTKSLRADDVSGFDSFTEEEKAEFVEMNKAEE